MSIRRFPALLLALAMLLSGCTSTVAEGDQIQIYYVRTYNQELDSALTGISWEGEAEVEALFEGLSTAPVDEAYSTLIPSRTTLKSWQLEDGILSLDLSAEFGTLTGIELTMASYCIVLTLCQLEGVDGVRITADGEALLEQEILTAQQVILDGGEGDTSVLSVELFFPLADGSGLGAEARTLTIVENRSQAESILDALCLGPEDKTLSAFLPDTDQEVTLWVQENVCYVNLTEDWQLQLEADWDTLPQKLQCIVNSLCQLDDVDHVQFLMDGAVLDDWGSIGAEFPMQASA